MTTRLAMLDFVSFFFNDTATTEIYTLSLHDALPIWRSRRRHGHADRGPLAGQEDLLQLRQGPHRSHPVQGQRRLLVQDRKSTRLNSSHANISYAVFCLKKKKKNNFLLDIV